MEYVFFSPLKQSLHIQLVITQLSVKKSDGAIFIKCFAINK